MSPGAHARRPEPILAGAGIGLRGPHYREVLETRPSVDWLEVYSENYFGAGGPPLAYLERARSDYPLSLHGVGLSLGSTDPLNARHLASLEAFDHVAARVRQVQDRIGRELLIENPSTYLQFVDSTIPEAEFLAELAQRAGCGILLDVNNVYVSARNHGFDALAYLRKIPLERIGEIHLAGHTVNRFEDGEVVSDSHDQPVAEPVWGLYRHALRRFGRLPTLIEWDTDLPALSVLVAEAHRADGLAAELAAVYPVVHRLVGEDYFRQVAREYVRRSPSTSGNLHAFGADFPTLFRRTPATPSRRGARGL